MTNFNENFMFIFLHNILIYLFFTPFTFRIKQGIFSVKNNNANCFSNVLIVARNQYRLKKRKPKKIIKAKNQMFNKCIEIGITTTYQTLNADYFSKCLALIIRSTIFSIWAYLLFINLMLIFVFLL